eukprot:gene2371-2933_t
MRGSNPNMSDDWNDSGQFSKCYQGIIRVNFLVSPNYDNNPDDSTTPEEWNARITGLFSSNEKWVNGYLSVFEKSDKLQCFYRKSNPYEVLPFAPILSKIGIILGSIFSVLFFFNLCMIGIMIFLKTREKPKIRYSSANKPLLTSTLDFNEMSISYETSEKKQKPPIQIEEDYQGHRAYTDSSDDDYSSNRSVTQSSETPLSQTPAAPLILVPPGKALSKPGAKKPPGKNRAKMPPIHLELVV